MNPFLYPTFEQFLDRIYFSNTYPTNILVPSSIPYNAYNPDNQTQCNKSGHIRARLPPRLQRLAAQSQNCYYEPSWRANQIAASSRHNLDPQRFQRRNSFVPVTEYDQIINNNDSLYSDYGSDSDDNNNDKDTHTIPQASLSTNKLLEDAITKANSNNSTLMSFAVIEADLHSITRLGTAKTENDFNKLLKQNGKLTEDIVSARKGLKDVALEIRSLKQDMKLSNKVQKLNRYQFPVKEFYKEKLSEIRFAPKNFCFKLSLY